MRQKLPLHIHYVAILPWEISGRYFEYFTFQQDEAPAHRARAIVDLLKQVTPDLIALSLWRCGRPTVNSTNINLISFAVRGILKDRFYKNQIKDTKELQQRGEQQWDGLD